MGLRLKLGDPITYPIYALSSGHMSSYEKHSANHRAFNSAEEPRAAVSTESNQLDSVTLPEHDQGESLQEMGYRFQRDEARAQRDQLKRQRDEARLQRNYWKERFITIEKNSSDKLNPLHEKEIKKITQEMFLHIKKYIDQSMSALEPRAGGPVSKSGSSSSDKTEERFAHINYYKSELKRAELRPSLELKRANALPLSVIEQEALLPRKVPLLSKSLPDPIPLPCDVAFITVGNDKFMPGLEGLLLSFRRQYPSARNDFYIFNDGSISDFAKARLSKMYPHVKFRSFDMEWLDTLSNTSDNHKRIGKLGYMNLHALELEGYERVIIVDSDILILSDISPLWSQSEQIYVCHDCGDREYVSFSNHTQDFIINSGIISIPMRYLNQDEFRLICEIAKRSFMPLNDMIDRFADQKVWNMYLANKETSILPVNYNCNIKYAIKYLGGNFEAISIVHFAGPKPWNNADYIHRDLLRDQVSKTVTYPKLWIDHYRSLLYKWRLQEYRDYSKSCRSARVKSATHRERADDLPTALFIGNGPSIAQTPLALAAGVEKFCFNWFILHDSFDEIKPDHLVLGSHMFFGGWNIQNPIFPKGYCERLYELKHRPVIWTSFYFKWAFEQIGLSKDFEINYVLFEKPFKRFIDSAGVTDFNLSGFLDDGRTGVISIGLPVAKFLGFKRVVLVGCDSNYNRTDTGANYFYNEARHTSLSTDEKSLTSTWEADGAGQYAYKIASESFERDGLELLDATIGGSIRDVKKIDFVNLFSPMEAAVT